MVTNRDRKSFGSRRKKIPNVAQTTGTIDVFDPRSGISGPTARRASTCPNLHELWTQPAQVRCPVVQLLIQPKSSGLPRLAREFIIIIIFIYAVGLLPGRSGYFTCKQNMKLLTTKFKSGRLHEKQLVATWNLGNHLSICF